jgi:hypothetical protein
MLCRFECHGCLHLILGEDASSIGHYCLAWHEGRTLGVTSRSLCNMGTGGIFAREAQDLGFELRKGFIHG